MSATSPADADPAPTPSPDPTQTTTKRRRLRQRLGARTEEVRGEVRSQLQTAGATGAAGTAIAGATAAAGALAMFRSLSAFRNWLRRLFESTVLVTAAPLALRRGTHWTASHTRDSYETGLRRARAALRQQDYEIGDRDPTAVMADGGHQDALSSLYERAYLDLDDAVTNTVQAVTRQADEQGLVGGEVSNVREAADFLTERIRAETNKRIDPLGDMIPVRSANRAALREYAAAGAERVGVDPEAADDPDGDVDWHTKRDGHVCEDCLRLARNGPYKIADVLQGDPAPPPSPHLRCRCFLVVL